VSSTLAVLVLLTLPLFGMGCGSHSGAVKLVSQDVLTRSDTLPPGVPSSVLTDVTPSEECGLSASGARLVLQAVSASGCEVADEHHPVSLGQSVVIQPIMFQPGRPGMFQRELPLVISLRRGDGRASTRTILPGQPSQWRLFLNSAFPLGQVTITARQNELASQSNFVVTRPAAQGVASNGSPDIAAGSHLSIVVTGAHPHSDVAVDVYRVQEVFTAADIRQKYVTTITLRSDAYGMAETRLLTRRDDLGSYLLSTRAMRALGDPAVELTITQPSVAGHAMRLPPGASPKDIFQKHEAPPVGVASQITYFAGAGPSVVCGQQTSAKPEIKVSGGEAQITGSSVSRTRATDASLQIGGELLLCMFNFQQHTPITVTSTTPDGHSTALTPVSQQGSWFTYYATMTPDMKLGTYRVTARQAHSVVRASFYLADAKVPGYRLISSAHHRPLVLVVGLQPNQSFSLLMYREPAEGGDSTAGYVGRIIRTADARGVATIELRPQRDDQHGCFAIRIATGHRVLADPEDGSTDVCLPYLARPPG